MSAASLIEWEVTRAEANKATGPVTPEGKRRSSMNALRHGLTGRVVVLPSEDSAKYLAFSQSIIESFSPKGAYELQLAQTIADQHWRLNRIRSIEEGIFAQGFAETAASGVNHPEVEATLTNAQTFVARAKDLNNLAIYEQRIHRLLQQTVAELRRIQKERKAEEEEQMKAAIELHDLAEREGEAWDPREDGFVFSKEEVELAVERKNRRHTAFAARMKRYGLVPAHEQDEETD